MKEIMFVLKISGKTKSCLKYKKDLSFSITLTLLIGISLILTGSLWFDNYYGLSSVMSDMVSFFYAKIDLEDTKYIKEYHKNAF